MASVPLDPDLVEAMGLPPEPSDRQVAEILARAADAPAPSGEDEVAIWMRFAVAMQEQLIERPQKMMDTAEAGHYPVSSFHNMLSEEEWGGGWRSGMRSTRRPCGRSSRRG